MEQLFFMTSHVSSALSTLHNIGQNHQVSSNLTSFWQLLCKEVDRKPIKIKQKRSANMSISPFLKLQPSNYPYLDISNCHCKNSKTRLGVTRVLLGGLSPG